VLGRGKKRNKKDERLINCVRYTDTKKKKRKYQRKEEREKERQTD
jgi:hypothetical protein